MKWDQRLYNAGVPPENAAKLRPRELQRIFDVDAVIRGHVLEANNFTGGIHAETLIGAKLDMLDLSTEETVWEVEHTEVAYSGIATPTIVDIIQEQMENAKVQQAYYKTAEMFCQKILKQIPDPADKRLHEVRPPVIEKYRNQYPIRQGSETKRPNTSDSQRPAGIDGYLRYRQLENEHPHAGGRCRGVFGQLPY